jgi:hypothetical protein
LHLENRTIPAERRPEQTGNMMVKREYGFACINAGEAK